MNKKKLLVLIIVFLVSALACSTLTGGGNNATDSGPPAAGDTGDGGDSGESGEGGDSPIGGGEDTGEPSLGDEGGEPSSGSEGDGGDSTAGPPSSLNLDDPDIYNQPDAIFNTYKNSLVHSFVEIDDSSTPVTGTVIVEGRTMVEPKTIDLTFRALGDAMTGGGDVFTYTEILDTAYIVGLEEGCFSGPVEEGLNPFEIFLDEGGDLTGQADYAGEDNVNGVATYKYDLSLENVTAFQAEGSTLSELTEGYLHIAQEGRYIVQIFIEGVGNSEILTQDPGLTGEVSYDLNFFDFDQPIGEILPPEGCSAPGEVPSDTTYPILEDASDFTQFAGIISYVTGKSVSEAYDFYKTEMSAIGCGSPTETLVSEDVILVDFPDCPQGNVTLSINVGDDGGAMVTLIGAE